MGEVRWCGPVLRLTRAFRGLSSRLRLVAGPKQFQQVVCGTDQLPFRPNFPDSAQQKGADTPCGLNLPEDRLHNRLSHLIQSLTCFGFQPLFHLLHRGI